MAIIKPGGVVAAVSGTIGGQNFVLGKQGAFCRGASKVKKGMSVIQLEHRRAIKSANYFWQNMSDMFRESWRHVAGTIPFVNRFGISRFLTGYQLFAKYVMENFSDETDFDIECDIIGYSSTPVIQISSILSDGQWQITTEIIGYDGDRKLKVFVSRPVRVTPIHHYSNWFRLWWDVETVAAMTIQSRDDQHPRLATCVVDEWIGFQLKRREFPASGRLLYSAPSIFRLQIRQAP